MAGALWLKRQDEYKPQIETRHGVKGYKGATPSELGPARADTQGSSFLATLGFGAESLWDKTRSKRDPLVHGPKNQAQPLLRHQLSARTPLCVRYSVTAQVARRLRGSLEPHKSLG